jgi:hypothetical protein
MKKVIAVAGLGAAIALGLLGGAAGTASASTEGFLQEMDTPFATHAEQLAEGNDICAAFTKGRTQNLTGPASASIITKISNYYANDGRAAAYGIRMMATTVKELCPANTDYMMAAARAYDAQAGE